MKSLQPDQSLDGKLLRVYIFNKTHGMFEFSNLSSVMDQMELEQENYERAMLATDGVAGRSSLSFMCLSLFSIFIMLN